MHITKTIVLLLFCGPLLAQFQQAVLPNLKGEDLRDELVRAYKPTTVLSYGAARDLMYGTIYNENDSVRCIYSGHTLFLPTGVDPSIFLFMDGSSNGINAEHAYPRSKGADDGNAYSDMHHLFPTRSAVNSARSNYPFGEIADEQATSWYYRNQTQSNTPTINIDLYSEKIDGRFEPREQQKGNIARAVFYFFTMYEQRALNADPTFFESQRETLCDWHQKDPVDQLEWDRTFEIGSYQNDLPNPFVLDATLASRAYCEDRVPDAPSGVSITPNPTIDWVTVTAAGAQQLKVVDVLGRVVLEEAFVDTLEVDLSRFSAGTYFFWLGEEVLRVVRG